MAAALVEAQAAVQALQAAAANAAADAAAAQAAQVAQAAQAAQAAQDAVAAAALAAAAAVPAAGNAPAAEGNEGAPVPGLAAAIAAAIQTNNEESPEQTKMIMNPRDAELRKLNAIENSIEFKSWMDDIKDKAEIRSVWIQLSNQLAPVPNVIQLTPYQTQMLSVLKSGIKASLGNQLRIELQPLLDANTIQDTACGIIIWLKEKLEVMGTAMERKAQTEFRQMRWKGTKISIAAWYAKLKLIGGSCGRAMAAGYPLDFAIREKLLKHVGEQSLDIAHLIRDFKRHAHDTPGFTNEDLVQALMVQMLKDETSGEKQCQTYAANIEPENKPKPTPMKRKKGGGGGDQDNIR